MGSSCPCSTPPPNALNGSGPFVLDWNAAQAMPPRSPLDVLLFAQLGETVGTFERSGMYVSPVNGWIANRDDGQPLLFLETAPICTATATEQGARVADAAQWMFDHRTMYTGSVSHPREPEVAPPLTRVLYMRAGSEWKNAVGIRFNDELSNVQLTFARNLMTRGDEQGTYPVLSFGAVPSETTRNLILTFGTPGVYSLALCGRYGNDESACLELEIWAVS